MNYKDHIEGKGNNKKILWDSFKTDADFLGIAKEAYDCGDYNNAWLLAQRAMFSFNGSYGSAVGMLMDMVKTGKYKINLDSVEEEPEIHFEDGKAKTTVRVKTATGICETTAAIVCGIAKRFRSKIELCKKGRTVHVDANHIIMVEALALMKGTEVEIQAEGEDAEEAVRALGKVFMGILVDG